jgi:hypothetical protein
MGKQYQQVLSMDGKGEQRRIVRWIADNDDRVEEEVMVKFNYEYLEKRRGQEE